MAEPSPADPSHRRLRCAALARFRKRGSDRAGADHGRAASRPSGAGAAGAQSGPTASSFRSSSTRRSSPPNEDFGTYPRTLKADIAALTAEKADLVWAPSAEVMYPDGFRHTARARRAPPRPGWKTSSARISSAASRPWSPNCSCNAARTSRCSARRTTSSSCRDADGRGSRSAASRSSACRRCARKTASRCRRATSICRRSSARHAPSCTARCRLAPPHIKAGVVDRACCWTQGAHTHRARRFALDYLEARHAADAGAGRLAQGRPDAASGRGEDRQDALIDNIAV